MGSERNSDGQTRKINWFYVLNAALLGLLALTILYPFYNAVLISLVSQKEYMTTPFMLWPTEITFDAYAYIFSSSRIYHGYTNTLLILTLGVPYNMLATAFTAYALSRERFPGKKIATALVVFTMYFSGGLIPLYLLVRDLGIMNSLASVILVYGANTFYLLLMRSYFAEIPSALEESAKIDGANDLVILLRIMLPLSMPIVATVTLFFSVDRWNEWFNAMLFLREGDKWPLQLVLRSIVMSTIDDIGSRNVSIRKTVFEDGVKMAAVFITMAPIMFTYPFLQKYFLKGMLVGSVKS
ncbi:carbohydrate ABC transporter permease [Cohnella hashimotonis]|uniref:Carbohydrate ABC transporter permease n=1 Tax=Cohnella hashimotonis TaxID=2826895 RepID=A0ABT6TEB4_9BACL|nr:carbohydrate ABC transporter permease [Cohnella hashimotonis]